VLFIVVLSRLIFFLAPQAKIIDFYVLALKKFDFSDAPQAKRLVILVFFHTRIHENRTNFRLRRLENDTYFFV